MLLREGAARNDAIDRALAISLALVAGALNAAVFYAAGFFAANMTGNVSVASDNLALGNWGGMFFYLLLVAAFIMGSCLSAVLIAAGNRRGTRRVYGYVLLGEAALLAGIGAMAPGVPESYRAALIIVSLAFLMGLQNAVVTRISGARVRTTHISGMATDLGIELAAMWDALRGHSTVEHKAENHRRAALHVATILAFFVGGVAGVLVYRQIGNGILLLAGVVLAAIALVGIAGGQQPLAYRPTLPRDP